ncbi:MAG: hypothetical protein Q7R35_19985 [Elusimicrobiota bacterium]|nr:hypothetical protein [Elusimicrobiota bacterium]
MVAALLRNNFVNLKVAGRVGFPRDAGKAQISRYGGPDSPDRISASAQAAGLPGIDRRAQAFTEIQFVLVLVGFELPGDIPVE